MIEVEVVKAKFITSKYANIGKKERIWQIFDKVKDLKNRISEYCYNHIDLVLNDKTFINYYKVFNNDFINNHSTQTLFNDILNFYRNHVDQLIDNLNNKIGIQTKFKLVENKFKIVKKDTSLTKMIKYLNKSVLRNRKINSFIDFKSEINKFKSKLGQQIKKLFNSLNYDKQYRIYNLFKSYQNKIFDRIKKIEFKTGSFRLTNGGYSYDLIYDKSNSKFKLWLKIKIHKNEKPIFYPILENEEYFKDKKDRDNFKKQIFLIDRRELSNSKKLFFALITDEKQYFEEEIKNIIGIDVNLTKDTFLISSNNDTLSYDEQKFDKLIKTLEKVDKKGYKNLSKNNKIKLRKSLNRFKQIIIKDIANWIEHLKFNGITDIIMEDLDVSKGNLKGYIEKNGKRIKLNRFIRFLHLSDLKNIFIQIAHNKGIRVHLTPSQYTSQQCSKCGSIDKNNRKSQSEYKCKCGNEINADLNAAKNIRNRFLNHRYLKKLHKLDRKFFELRPKKFQSYDDIKNILEENVSPPINSNKGLHHPVNLWVTDIYELSNVFN